MTNKLTAVQWLVEQILVEMEDYFNEENDFDLSKPPKIKYYNAFIDSVDLSGYVNKAIEMEKEQIMNAYRLNTFLNYSSEEYYEKTYAKNS